MHSPRWSLCLAIVFTTRCLSNFLPQQSLCWKTFVNGDESLFSFHRRLIEIPSITGNEQAVATYLEQYLVARNFTVEKQKVGSIEKSVDGAKPGSSSDETRQRYNLLAYPGKLRNTRVLLSSHIDTVPPYLPYELREHDQIWGRGSVDDKACVATQTKAVEELLASGEVKAGDVALLFVVGEETGGDGMKKANDLGLAWETVIFGEPTELKLVSGHKGITLLTIKATGKAGHSGYPWLGENAISILIPALLELEKLPLPSSKKYGNSTLNIGRIEGGVASNVIPESAKAEISIRIADGTPDEIRNVLSKAVRSIDDRLELQVVTQGYGPIYIDSDVEGLRLSFFRLTLSFLSLSLPFPRFACFSKRKQLAKLNLLRPPRLRNHHS